LGSTSLTADAFDIEVGRQRYYPFGAPRNSSGALNTDYRFTGQRSEETNLGSLYDYGGRFYSPVLGRFLSADSIVPRPGDPQSLNRYSYARNNPLIRVDPSGHADCAADDRACWEDEWHWKNRWYNAHGYALGDDGHWSQHIDPVMADAGIARDVLAEADIYLSGGGWLPEEIMQMARGVARFGQALAESGGLARLRELLGATVRVRNWSLCGGPCAPPANVWFSWEVWFPTGRALNDVAGLFVHELAHVIDWNSHYAFSGHWGYAPLTDYATNNKRFYPQSWDRWAEAVAVWVMGELDASGTFAIKGTYPILGQVIPSLTVQLDRINDLLNGRR